MCTQLCLSCTTLTFEQVEENRFNVDQSMSASYLLSALWVENISSSGVYAFVESCVIGTSVSESHTSESNGRFFILSVVHILYICSDCNLRAVCGP